MERPVQVDLAGGDVEAQLVLPDDRAAFVTVELMGETGQQLVVRDADGMKVMATSIAVFRQV